MNFNIIGIEFGLSKETIKLLDSRARTYEQLTEKPIDYSINFMEEKAVVVEVKPKTAYVEDIDPQQLPKIETENHRVILA